MNKKIFIEIYIYINIYFVLLVKANEEKCKIIYDRRMSKYILNGKCNDGIYYINNLTGKETSELKYDICAKEGSITKYIVYLGKIQSTTCVNAMKNINLRENDINSSTITSGSNEEYKGYKLFKDKFHEIPSENGNYLFYCNSDNTECVPKKNVGYYVNGEDYIISGKGDTDIQIEYKIDSAETECTTENIGKIFYVNEDHEIKFLFCLDYKPEIAKKVYLEKNAGKYLVNYSNNNIFGLNIGQFAIVDITESSVEMNKQNNEVKYIYVNKDNNKLFKRGDICPSDRSNMIEYICISL